MNSNVAEKIAKGYKKTEVGIIPEDWEVKKIGKISDINPDNLLDTTNPDYIFKYISLEDVDFGHLKNFSELIFKNAPSRARRKIQKGDVLISTVRPNLKAHLLIQKAIKDFVCSTGFSVIRSKNYKANSAYIFNHFFGSIINKQIDNLITGSNYPAINSKDIKQLLIPVPQKKSEQTAIAKVLSDTDALIESLEKLIAKKKAIKQGAMQQLLTGKKRLPGFSGEWKTKELNEIGNTYGGLSGKTLNDFQEGKYPYIPFLNIMNNPIIDINSFDYVNIQADEKQNRVIKGDLFFNGSSETPEEVGMCSVLLNDIQNLYLNSFCFGFRFNRNLSTDGLYLSYFFRSLVGRKLIFSLAQGATRYNLSKTSFMKLKIPYPEHDEQTAIANILSDMDSEIEKLEQKKDKYILLKQGMMQQLLTGKIRLVKNGDN